jgi:adenylate cyclase
LTDDLARPMLAAMAEADAPDQLAAAELARLLDARNEHPESLSEIDTEIWQRFGRTQAVLVLDMCGFSRLTMRYGITHFLAMIRRLGLLVRPVVAARGGRVVKAEADNLFAVFDDVPQALGAARAIQDRLAAANTFLPEDWDLNAGIGIGYGPVLLVGESDLFGSEMNVASKLGEDVAGRGEILLSSSAHARLAASDGAFEALALEMSGLALHAYKVKQPG